MIPVAARHHAQTIACTTCGPRLELSDTQGNKIHNLDPIREAAELLDAGKILAMRGVGGFHLACIEESADELKHRLGRIEQPFAIMVRPDYIDQMAVVSDHERKAMESPVHPIVVLKKRDPTSHAGISNLHTIGCMLPVHRAHHLLFRHLRHPLLVMTSANMPGYPMITGNDQAMAKLNRDADFFLSHNREIVNRCDDSVIRDGYIIRLSRGIAPKRTAIDLGKKCILGVGPELNANATLYRNGFTVTSPHVGNVRNPATLEYLEETVRNLQRFLGQNSRSLHTTSIPSSSLPGSHASWHRTHGLDLVPVQHHRAHIAATTTDPCIGIAIDGVGTATTGRSGERDLLRGRCRISGALPILNRSMPGGRPCDTVSRTNALWDPGG